VPEVPAGAQRTILFGDLHVHTSFSWDGFVGGLPLVGGEGAHPPADACDYARWCSGLDFFALTDHAESLLHKDWQASKESVRECNARAGDPRNPDLVAFMGFEWSQAGATPEKHWGHRNVIFHGTADAELPARPISSGDRRTQWAQIEARVSRWRWVRPQTWSSSAHLLDFLGSLSGRPLCPVGVDTRELPRGCQEVAPTPRELHEKLDQWGFPVLTIPHGTAWGNYTPATATIDKHLAALHFDAERMRLIEIMSGHGSSEEYRRYREFEVGEDGRAVCPAPTADFLPCCWQAGEIMRQRCGDLPQEACERRVELAKKAVMESYTEPHRVFPDAAPEDWLDCDQCRDCFKPAFSLRPRESVQYAMALSRSDPDAPRPRRFRYGFVASSDNHAARPGTGFKQHDPEGQSEAVGEPPFPIGHLRKLEGRMEDRRLPNTVRARARRLAQEGVEAMVVDLRIASFVYPGGLAAVHAVGRSRAAIWEALLRREVYGTSGPRILLWFDLLNGVEGRAPMGSEHVLAEIPRFEVRAVGSLEPRLGCPEESLRALSSDRLERLCRSECHFPGDRRRRIVAIEVVRILPRATPGEPVAGLIEDPWRRFECPEDAAGCVVRFEDPEFLVAARDSLYYVRALEEPTPALNGRPLETLFDADGNAIAVTPCAGERVDAGGCPAPVSERAWSSPIFVDLER
jgi:hypothetical protein